MPVVYDKIINKRANRKLNFLPYIILAIPPCILIAIYFIFRSSKNFSAVIVNNFALPTRRFLGFICSFVPFSITELVYIAVALFAIIFLLRTIMCIIRSNTKLIAFGKRMLILLLILLYYYSSFCFLWKFDYYSPTFAEKSGLSTEQFSTEALIKITSLFVEKVSELAEKAIRDEKGNYAENTSLFFNSYKHIYDNVQSEFSCIEGEVYRPKPMYLFSKIMSLTGFTGIYVAYTGESNINIEAPPFTIPCTISHELAHQLGVYAEDEANFLGMLACIKSGNTIYQYSGYFGATIHLMNALYKADKSAWNELRANFSDELENDWNYNNEYWRSMESSVSETASTIYDNYLKSNGQTQGIIAYSQCVILLVNYFAATL